MTDWSERLGWDTPTMSSSIIQQILKQKWGVSAGIVYRPNSQRITHHLLTGLSLQGYTYLTQKSSCTATQRRGSFWWSVRAWSPQWRGHGLGSGTSRFGFILPFRLKQFDSSFDWQVHHDYLPCFPNGPQARIRRRGRHGRLHCVNLN